MPPLAPPPPPSLQQTSNSADVVGGVSLVLSVFGIVAGGFVLMVLLRFVCIKRRDAKEASVKTWLADEGVIKVKGEKWRGNFKQKGLVDEEEPGPRSAASAAKEAEQQAVLDRRRGKVPSRIAAAEVKPDADAAASRDAAAKALSVSPHLLGGSRDAVTDKGAILTEAAEAAVAGAAPSSGRCQWLGGRLPSGAAAPSAAAAVPPPLAPPSLDSPDPAPGSGRRHRSSSRPSRSGAGSGSPEDGTRPRRQSGEGASPKRQSGEGTSRSRQSGDGASSRRQSGDGASHRHRSGEGASPRRQSGDGTSSRDDRVARL